ncbi:MAG: GMC family oxidoreductase [Planctomycetes bacterium]|nr:GMC family oxidoreductase [Planctomycetota bacterium]
MQNDYDVIIIGTGAGGGTLLHQLAPSGKRILVIERGAFLPRERENWDPNAVFRDGRYQAKERWYDKFDAPFTPYTHYWVGGNTKVYGAALLRMREFDFGEVRHHGGLSPAWPISYDDFEPYYTKAEHLYSVHGRRGSDPYEPPASAPYRHEPIPHEPRIQELFDDLTALGHRPFPIPIGVRLNESRVPHAPYKLSNFDGFPDLTEVKADSHVVAVQPALGHPNVTIMTECLVVQLVTSATGREVVGVEVDQNGARETYRAGIVVVACGAINSAALLLRSVDGRHPDGLANSSGLVGRNYMCHNNGLFIAVFDRPNPSQFQKTFGMTDFYRAADDSPLPLGTIQLMGKLDLDSLKSLAVEALPNTPVEEISARSVDFFLTAEDLPSPENRVTLRPDGSIKLTYTATNVEAYERLRAKLASVLDEADLRRGGRGGTYLHTKLGISGVSHQNGTLRFGRDPQTSVLDVNCKAHDLDNLYVVDGSFFPSSSAVNPSLTIMANALRVCDHLLTRLR